MMLYILEIFAFQLLFLLAYDIFLRKETFFQWNRFYLLFTFVLSLVLPWIKLEALRTTVSSETVFYPEFLWQMPSVDVVATQELSFWELLNIYEWIFLCGAVAMAIWFVIKLYRIQRLRSTGIVRHFPQFTKVVVQKSEVAFSFFKQVFLGDGIAKEKEPQILAHELVHIKQWHSLDLLFFELMRIGLWFNPLVYVYQNRLAELHEFIADAQVAKENKREQYQLLLSEVFQTQNLSFVNQFFKKSLLKKRIVMLAKQKSKTIYQFKYALLLPLVLGMLVYSSCERDLESEQENQTFENITQSDAALIARIEAEINTLSAKEFFSSHASAFAGLDKEEIILSKEDYFRQELYFRDLFERIQNGPSVSERTYDFLKNLPYPSTARYESYVDRKKAFQTLDRNLKISIKAYREDVRSIENKSSYPSDYFVLEVPSVRKLQTPDIITFNNKMKEVFETGSNYKAIVVKDDEFAFQVYKKVYITNSGSASAVNLGTQKVAVDAKSVPFALIDEVPIFPGCENVADKKACFQESMQNHIRKHFNYPIEAQELGLQGRVSVMFTIDESGYITNIRKRGPYKILETEVERIINRLPVMTPGKQNGAVVKVPFSIPVTFKLSEEQNENLKTKKIIHEAFINMLDKTDRFEILPKSLGLGSKTDKLVKRHNELVSKRNRLLQSSNKENSVIKILEDQLLISKIELQENLNILLE